MEMGLCSRNLKIVLKCSLCSEDFRNVQISNRTFLEHLIPIHEMSVLILKLFFFDLIFWVFACLIYEFNISNLQLRTMGPNNGICTFRFKVTSNVKGSRLLKPTIDMKETSNWAQIFLELLTSYTHLFKTEPKFFWPLFEFFSHR